MFLYFIWYVISLPEQAPPPCLPHWTPHRDTLTVPRDMIPDPPSRITSSSYSRRHLAARVPAQQDGARRRAPCSRGVALRSDAADILYLCICSSRLSLNETHTNSTLCVDEEIWIKCVCVCVWGFDVGEEASGLLIGEGGGGGGMPKWKCMAARRHYISTWLHEYSSNTWH